MSVRVELEGWEELERKLQSIGDKINAREALEDALMDGAEIVKAEIEAAAPARTGQLQGDIHISRRGREPYSVRIGPGIRGFYGRYSEYGTQKMAARPFMRPAFESSNAAVQDAIRAAISRAVREAAG